MSLLLSLKERYFVSLYAWRLTRYSYPVSKGWVKQDTKLGKASLEYRKYVTLLQMYSWLLRNIRQHGPHFLKTLQEYRLRHIVRTAATIPWWQERFRIYGIDPSEISNLHDLARIPPIRRPDLISVPLEWLASRPFNPRTMQRNTTSGSTTGTPFTVLFEKSVALVNVTAHYLRTIEERGFPFEKVKHRDFIFHVNLFGTALRLTTAPEQFAQAFKIRGEDLDVRQKFEHMCEEMGRVGACVLFTHPSELPFIIQKLEEFDLHPPVKLCLVIGQMLENEIREYAESYLSCEVISMFGLREYMLIASSCKTHPDLFHVHTERAIIEILDTEDKPITDSEFGSLTITGLDNLVMPLIRYQSGDRARFRTDIVCACENQAPLYEIDSRESEVLEFAGGEVRPVRKILKLFGIPIIVSSVRKFQIRQDSPRRVAIAIEARKKPLAAKVVRLLEQRIRGDELIPPYAELAIVEVDSIGENDPSKHKVFIPFRGVGTALT